MKVEQIEKNAGILFPSIDSKAFLREFRRKTLKKSAIIAGISILLFAAAAGGLFEQAELAEGNFIRRRAFGQGSKTVKLTALIQDEEHDISVEVIPQSYTQQELENLFISMLPLLERQILGVNNSACQIREDLSFNSSIEGYPFSLSYESSDYGLITGNGTVLNDEVPGEGKDAGVKISARCGEYVNHYYMELHVCPPEMTLQEKRRQRLSEEIYRTDMESREGEWLRLPGEVDGMTVEWMEDKGRGACLFLLLGALCVPLIWAAEEQKIQKEIERRDKELLREYPELISRLTLLLGAGMTVRGAFFKLAEEGKKRQEQAAPGRGGREGKIRKVNSRKLAYDYKRDKNYLQQELVLLCRDIEMGVYESQAYLHFGERCGLQQYRRMAALLMQNLKMGSRGLLAQLEYETHNALEEKKAQAKKSGEEAGNKLLLPMTAMLLLVMVIVIVPAFGSFRL